MSSPNGVSYKMNVKLYRFTLAIIAILSFILIHCGPPKTDYELPRKTCAPSNLTVQPGDSSMLLKWDTGCTDNIVLTGYNIYIQSKPLNEKYQYRDLPSKIKPYNSGPYPGDTDPEDSYETINIGNLENGVEYFVTVRAAYADRGHSMASNEVSVICRPEGEFELAYRYAGENDGFNLAEGTVVRADSDSNDLYFYHKDGLDYLASPKRLNGYLRESQFYSLGVTEDIYQHPEIELDIPPVDRIPIRVGESCLIKTSDGNFAKIRLEEASGELKGRTLKLRYIYQTLKNRMRF